MTVTSKVPVITRGTATAAVSQVVPADNYRLFVEVKNLSATDNIEISGANPFTYGQGHPILPGQSYVHKGAVPLYAICAGGKTADYSIMDLAL